MKAATNPAGTSTPLPPKSNNTANCIRHLPVRLTQFYPWVRSRTRVTCATGYGRRRCSTCAGSSGASLT